MGCGRKELIVMVEVGIDERKGVAKVNLVGTGVLCVVNRCGIKEW